MNRILCPRRVTILINYASSGGNPPNPPCRPLIPVNGSGCFRVRAVKGEGV